ncbi:Chloramphenicol phosphotransferase-like protein [Thermomonospora echinospora]|uniref:Chloramphenicol phosphotransferase-like protein n=1 Tax=Thermomonospora echinospora TaxID=1992 RepID=A0A1H6B3U6_9ACTN|nr:AAA family ATPase [Thermomonospora echinospora]SEG55065.1 Chloramphenicol phosphotransferase-like protein [Thermomonospora echinospora]
MVRELDGAVVLITGIMASGKSTVAQLLAERLPRAVHLRGDLFRRMIVSGRAEMTPEADAEAVAQLRLRYQASASVADLYAQAGWTVIVQDVILGEHLNEYLAALRSRPLYLVVLVPDAQAVAAREAARAKTGYGAWAVEALDDALRHQTPRRGLWLDTTHQTPDQSVRAILADLEKARIEG